MFQIDCDIIPFMEVKICSKCGLEKPLFEFNRDKNRRDGCYPQCRGCTRSNSRIFYQNNKTKVLTQHSRWKNKNKKRIKLVNAEWYLRNLEHAKQIRSKYRRVHKREAVYRSHEWRIQHPERARFHYKKWRYNNRGVVNMHTEKHRSIKLKATLSGISNSSFVAFYIEAARLTKETGRLWHVDHVVPLQGKNVCGLHVPWNLQVIPGVENCKKGNRFEPNIIPLVDPYRHCDLGGV